MPFLRPMRRLDRPIARKAFKRNSEKSAPCSVARRLGRPPLGDHRQVTPRLPPRRIFNAILERPVLLVVVGPTQLEKLQLLDRLGVVRPLGRSRPLQPHSPRRLPSGVKTKQGLPPRPRLVFADVPNHDAIVFQIYKVAKQADTCPAAGRRAKEVPALSQRLPTARQDGPQAAIKTAKRSLAPRSRRPLDQVSRRPCRTSCLLARKPRTGRPRHIPEKGPVPSS